MIRWKKVPRKVLAFYYPWYGTPEVSGRWMHYQGVDTERKTIANFTHYPSIGPFDSRDPKVVARHMELAKRAGIDGFIVSWWGKGSFSDRAMSVILDEAAKRGIEISVYYERTHRPGDPKAAVGDLLYILKSYGSHKAFQKLNKKPVIFIYGRAMGQLEKSRWASVLAEVNRAYPGGFVAIADGFSRTWARIFDGIHIYNCAGFLAKGPLDEALNTVEKRYSDAIALAENFARISAVTVIPGYDDTKIRRPGLKVERLDGRLYKQMWDMAIKLDPDWVLITSFNEWHEGSEIDTSLEYGDLYIELTRRYSSLFKSSPRRPGKQHGGVSALEKLDFGRLRNKFDGKKIAILPGAGIDLMIWLGASGLDFEELSWGDLADSSKFNPRNFPLAVYGGGERYRQSVSSEEDVDSALLGYLKSGGGPF